MTDKGTPPTTWSDGVPFCIYFNHLGTKPKARSLLLSRLAQGRHRSRILLTQCMYPVASTINGVGIT